jgi:hypothetical protein
MEELYSPPTEPGRGLLEMVEVLANKSKTLTMEQKSPPRFCTTSSSKL